jgi:hypothetical protein
MIPRPAWPCHVGVWGSDSHPSISDLRSETSAWLGSAWRNKAYSVPDGGTPSSRQSRGSSSPAAASRQRDCDRRPSYAAAVFPVFPFAWAAQTRAITHSLISLRSVSRQFTTERLGRPKIETRRWAVIYSQQSDAAIEPPVRRRGLRVEYVDCVPATRLRHELRLCWSP